MKQPKTSNQFARVAALEAAVELKRKYARVYASDEGRAVIDDIVYRICQYKALVMNSANPIATYENAVKRDVATLINNMIHEKVSDGSSND